MNIPNKKGDTCMNLAIQSGKEEVVSFLLSCHAVTGSDDNSQLLPLLVQAITAGRSLVKVIMVASLATRGPFPRNICVCVFL